MRQRPFSGKSSSAGGPAVDSNTNPSFSVLLDRCRAASGHNFGHSGVDAVECRGCSTATVPSDQLDGSPIR